MQAESYRAGHAKLISITNIENCHLGAISDLNLNYRMPVLYAPGYRGPQNLTTQMPVVYLLETLARDAAGLKAGTQQEEPDFH